MCFGRTGERPDYCPVRPKGITGITRLTRITRITRTRRLTKLTRLTKYNKMAGGRYGFRF